MTSINMRSVLYCRVSTTDQNVDMQLAALREYAERRGWQVTGLARAADERLEKG